MQSTLPLPPAHQTIDDQPDTLLISYQVVQGKI